MNDNRESCAFCGAPGADDVYKEEDCPDAPCCSDEEACQARIHADENRSPVMNVCACGQINTGHQDRCPACLAEDRKPQGEQWSLFSPAPAPLAGQLTIGDPR